MIVFKIMPADSGSNLSKIEDGIKAAVNVKKVEREPIAFGLEAIKATVFMMDNEGESDRVEEKIRSIEGVGEVEVLEMTRLM
jgi:elongation factor 1-beta